MRALANGVASHVAVWHVQGSRQCWNGALEDHFATISAASFQGYTTRPPDEGYIFSGTSVTSSEPYQLWRHQGRGDNITSNGLGAVDAQRSNYVRATDQGRQGPDDLGNESSTWDTSRKRAAAAGLELALDSC